MSRKSTITLGFIKLSVINRIFTVLTTVCCLHFVFIAYKLKPVKMVECLPLQLNVFAIFDSLLRK